MLSIPDNILYESPEFIVVNKDAGVPVQADQSTDEDLWTAIKNHYIEELYLVNRLDRPVSGVVVFARDKKNYNAIIGKWHSREVIKEYLAIVEGKWDIGPIEILDKIKKGRNNKAIIHPKGKSATLKIESHPIFDNYSFCKIQLITGKFHQIRIQLSHAGHPIKGDVKYGARRKNPDRSIHLHAHKITIGGVTVVAPFPDRDILWKTALEYYNNS